MKKRDLSLDCIRILAIFLILIFHYASTMFQSDSMFLFHANGTWGSLGTAIFFLLSGYLLRKRYSEMGSVLSFYKKRWLSIFPAFYLAFIVCYLINVIRLRDFFYEGPAYSLVYTLLGIDNLVKWFGISSYAIVGEWFTGIIVILYILFPLLNKFMKSGRWSVSFIFLVFYIIYNIFEWYPLMPEISLVSNAFIFWVGMLIGDYDGYLRKRYTVGILSLVISLLLLFISLPIPELFSNHIIAVFMFVAGINILKNLKTDGRVAAPIIYLSSISYPVYLVHHYIVNVIFLINRKTGIVDNIPRLILFCGYLAVVFITATVLYHISNYIVRKIEA